MSEPAALYTAAPNAVQLGDLARLGFAIADRAVVDDIKSMSVADQHDWLDTRPMLDQREHPPAWLDMAAQALQYAEQRRLIVRHPEQPHLVRITRARA